MDEFKSLINEIKLILPSLKIKKDIQSDYSNWVIPGLLMCGPYPYVDGINFPTNEEGDLNLGSIINDEIDTFICLQAEIPPQCSQNFEINHPYFPKFEYYSKVLNNNFLFYYFPIKDGTIPPINIMILYIKAILEIIRKGRKIYVHCAGGHGRSGTVLACIIGSIYDLTIEEILEYIQNQHDSRRITDKRARYPTRSPNTNEQIQFVKEYLTFIKFLNSF